MVETGFRILDSGPEAITSLTCVGLTIEKPIKENYYAQTHH